MIEAEYLRRKQLLEGQLAAAQEAHSVACLDLEDGQATEAHVSEASQRVEGLRARISGLSLAWQRQREKAAEEADNARQKRRSEARKTVAAQLRKRAKAAKAMENALKSLIAANREYDSASANISEAGRALLSGDDLASFRWTVSPPDRRDHILMSAALVRAGVTLNPANTFAGGLGADDLVSNEANRSAMIERLIEERD